MKNFFCHIKIKTKIVLLYITVLLLSFFMTFTIISIINEKYTEQGIGDAGIQTVNALKGNLSFIFDNVTQFSNLIYFDDNVQESLNKIDSKDINPVIQRTITKSLVNMILSGDYISSVFIFDQYYNYYNSNKVGPILVHKDKIESTNWYQSIDAARGNGFYIHKSEDVLEFPARTEKNYISYIREIGNKDTYEPLAILLVTIDAETIQSYFQEVSAASDSQFFIIDSNGEYIITPNQYEEEFQDYIKEDQENDETYETINVKDSKMIMVSQDMGIKDWRLVGAFKMNHIETLTPYYSTIIILIMCLNVVFVFVCSIVLTRLIFKPLSKVEKHMQLVENGEFVEMLTEDNNDEITRLKKVFNHMTKSIQNLIQKVKDEEQVIAKGKLDIMQAQINPHFLYNTLDAVSALALMKDNENCFKMTQALGSFYRNSLNSGMDFISVHDEIQCIQSYITILNIRYDDKIRVDYDIEPQVQNMKILKLLLHPLIENAVHHGIKGKDGSGHIIIKAFRDEDEIIFIITDDGIGITEERIEEIMQGKTITGKSGFGIYSLMQRIRIYYKIDNPITIHSEVGSETEITVRVRVYEEGGQI